VAVHASRTLWGDDDRFKKAYCSEVPAHPRYYFTGDGARQDKDGYFWIVGRIDDVLNVSGHRIGTAEVESALVCHPSVAEAAAVGRPDELKGQALVVFVTRQEPVSRRASRSRRNCATTSARKSVPLAKPDRIRFAAGAAEDALRQDHAPDPQGDCRGWSHQGRHHDPRRFLGGCRAPVGRVIASAQRGRRVPQVMVRHRLRLFSAAGGTGLRRIDVRAAHFPFAARVTPALHLRPSHLMPSVRRDHGIRRRPAQPRLAGAAFTLIELLTVIAIVGLSVSFAIGGLFGAKQRSAIAQAKSELAALRAGARGLQAPLWGLSAELAPRLRPARRSTARR
jgi:prepilin-type N-terminal cleavage/methylation domain-containing protein